MELIKYSGHLSYGRQMSLPENEIAIPISPQNSFGDTCINYFFGFNSIFGSFIIPILGGTKITCKSAIIPTLGTFASRRIRLTIHLPIPFNETKPSIVSRMFSSFWLVCAIFKSNFALVLKFLILEIHKNNASLLEIVALSIFWYASNTTGAILLTLAKEFCAYKTIVKISWCKLLYFNRCFFLHICYNGSKFLAHSVAFSNKSVLLFFEVH